MIKIVGNNKRYRKRNNILKRGTFEYESTGFKFT